MSKLSIVFTGSPTEQYHPDSGGIQLAEYSFCESPNKDGWYKTVIFRGDKSEILRSKNINRIPINAEHQKLGGLADIVPFSLRASATIRELCDKGEDCVHFTSLIPAMVYYDQPINTYLNNKSRLNKTKFFYTIHNFHYGVSNKPEDVFANYPEEWEYLHQAEHRVVNHADKTFVTCKRYVSELSSKFNRDISYLPNTVGSISGYDIDVKNGSEYKIILTLCRVEEEKNLERLILAFNKARKTDTRVRLIIGGEGSLLESLIKKCEKERLKSRFVTNISRIDKLNSILDVYDIVFVGKVENEKKRFLFESCDCIALFSLREICSLFGLEAIAYGKRILASRIPGWIDYEDFGADVLLSDPYDIEDIAKTIILGTSHIKESSSKISKTNKNIYNKHYSPDAVSAIRYSLYEDCLRSNL